MLRRLQMQYAVPCRRNQQLIGVSELLEVGLAFYSLRIMVAIYGKRNFTQ
jgi:hypothetical protein